MSSDDDDMVLERKVKKSKKEKKEKKSKKEKKRKRRDDSSDEEVIGMEDLGQGSEEDDVTSSAGRSMEGTEEGDEKDDESDSISVGRNALPDRMGAMQARLEAIKNLTEDEIKALDIYGTGDAQDGADGPASDDDDYGQDYQAPQYTEADQAMEGKYPTIADPKLFMVRVKGGFGRTLCAQIMYKCLTRAARGQDMMIKSVFCRDHLSEYIYIEAHRQAHVLNVISGLQGAWRNRITLIPVQEMPSTLAPVKESHKVKKGSWARFRYGLHKGDLCKIIDINDSKEVFEIEVIPRVDFEKLFDTTEGAGSAFRVQKLKTRTRPLQRFFTDDEFRQTRMSYGDTKTIQAYAEQQETLAAEGKESKSDIQCLGKKFSFSGHEIKTIRQNAVYTDRRLVNMTTDDHIRFERGKIPQSNRDLKRLLEIREVDLVVGDKIRVVQGELKNTSGFVKEIIEEVTGTNYLVQLDVLEEAIPLTKEDLQKVIENGRHVKIITGGHKGETGMVVDVHNDKVRVYSSRQGAEYEVFMSDVIESKEMSATTPTFGQFEVYELVKIRGTSNGMILKIENGLFTLLTNLGRCVTVHYAELQYVIASTRMSQQRKGRRQTGLDKFGNEIQQDDMVRVVAEKSLWYGKIANVRHVFLDTVWLEAKDVLENMGFFVLTRSEVWLVGGDKHQADMSLESYEKPVKKTLDAMELQLGAVADTNAKKQRRKERDMLSLVGKRVRIDKGYYKGFLGVITAIHGDQVRVEMHTGEMGLTVPLNDVKEVGIHDALATKEQVETRMRIDAVQKKVVGEAKPGDNFMDIERYSDAGTEVPSAADWQTNYSSQMSGASKPRSLAPSSSRSRAGSLAGSLPGSLAGSLTSTGSRKPPSKRRRLGADSVASGGTAMSTRNLLAHQRALTQPEHLDAEPKKLSASYQWWMVQNSVANWVDPETPDKSLRVKLVRECADPLYVIVTPIEQSDKGRGERKVQVTHLRKTDPAPGRTVVSVNRPTLPQIESVKGVNLSDAGDAKITIQGTSGSATFEKGQVIELA